MEERTLAKVEPRLPVTAPEKHHFRHWKFTIEAACWLSSSNWESAADIEFCIEYVDSLKKHQVLIDKTTIPRLSDGLMNGRFTIAGFGPMRHARLLFKSSKHSDLLDTMDLKICVIGARNCPERQFKLVA